MCLTTTDHRFKTRHRGGGGSLCKYNIPGRADGGLSPTSSAIGTENPRPWETAGGCSWMPAQSTSSRIGHGNRGDNPVVVVCASPPHPFLIASPALCSPSAPGSRREP